MTKVLTRIEKLLDLAGTLLVWISLAAISIQVFCRYVLGNATTCALGRVARESPSEMPPNPSPAPKSMTLVPLAGRVRRGRARRRGGRRPIARGPGRRGRTG